MDLMNEIKFNEEGLVLAIAQDWTSREVLMAAYMNREAIEKTAVSKLVHYYSRSRQRLWLKGETSGHFQHVKQITLDCDGDALLILVEQEGSACHTGQKSCFYRAFGDSVFNDFSFAKDVLRHLQGVIEDRQLNPKEGSYTNYLFGAGIDKMLKKVGEESTEVVIAAKNNDKSELTAEMADLLYHLSVVMVNAGIAWDDVLGEMERRSK